MKFMIFLMPMSLILMAWKSRGSGVFATFLTSRAREEAGCMCFAAKARNRWVELREGVGIKCVSNGVHAPLHRRVFNLTVAARLAD